MGPHEAKHSTIAYYLQPAEDGSRPGRYYLNTTAPETRPRYEAEALAFHESVPGHHLQLAIGQELAGLPAFRRHAGIDGLRRGLGAVRRAAQRRDGPLLGRPRPDRHRLVRRLAGLPARRRHGDARARLVARPGDRVHARAHGARPGQHRQRGRPLHHLAGPGARLQARPARDPAAARRGPRRASAAASTSAPSTTRCCRREPSRCRRCGPWWSGPSRLAEP